MTSFYYKESSRKNALRSLTEWLLFVPIWLLGLIAFQKSHPTMVMFVSPIVVFVSLLLAVSIYKVFKSSGDWVIILNDSEFIWKTPNNLNFLGEKSFQLKLSQIEKIIGEARRSLDEIEIFYFLKLKTGTQIDLITNSNMDMRKLIEALQDKGIEYEQQPQNT